MNDAASGLENELTVAEAIGPPVSPLAATSAIYLGSLALLMVGVMPALLGALTDIGRLSAQGIGLCATLESLSLGVSAGLCGIALKAERLRLIAALSSALLAALDLASIPLGHAPLMAVRTLAGMPEGVLLWLTVGMIARSTTPERVAGVFWTALVSGQLVLAMALVVIIPRFGPEGGFVALAVTAITGVAASFWAPRRYPPLVEDPGTSGAPPPRGWIALIATLIYTAAGGAVMVYLQPLAQQAGLSADIARTAVSASLAAQVVGGLAATALAGRVHYFTVFVLSSMVFVGSWLLLLGHPSAGLFLAASAAFGFVVVLIGPFLVPMTIEADPTRRTAMQSGATQLLAGALGPLLASFVVDDRHAGAVVTLGAVLIVIGLALMGVLYAIALRERRRGAARKSA